MSGPPTPRLLLLEPETDLADSLGELLEHAGFSVGLAGSWRDLDGLLAEAQSWTLAVLDVAPTAEGQAELERELKRPELARLPLLGMSTALIPPHPRLRELLRKPFDPAELIAAVLRHSR